MNPLKNSNIKHFLIIGHVMETISLKVVLSILIGALLGFGYYKLVGCRTGNCIISGNPYIATLYGAFLGYLWSAQ